MYELLWLGLRNLSIKVKEIVMEMKHTTYKDVAERLIKELIYEAKIEDGENVFHLIFKL